MREDAPITYQWGRGVGSQYADSLQYACTASRPRADAQKETPGQAGPTYRHTDTHTLGIHLPPPPSSPHPARPGSTCRRSRHLSLAATPSTQTPHRHRTPRPQPDGRLLHGSLAHRLPPKIRTDRAPLATARAEFIPGPDKEARAALEAGRTHSHSHSHSRSNPIELNWIGLDWIGLNSN